VACAWRWTLSVTGQVYVQGPWSPTGEPAPTSRGGAAEQLLHSVEGLPARLAAAWPAGGAAPQDRRWAALSPRELERVRHARAATEAGYFNEGVPLAQLRQEGVPESGSVDDASS
jgi:hypothetical protein